VLFTPNGQFAADDPIIISVGGFLLTCERDGTSGRSFF